MQNSPRYVTLDGMRGLAALAVMLYHVTQYTRYHLFPGGPLAVDFFFCLSGFVMAHAYGARLLSNMHLTEFAARRLIRLYPMFLIGMAIGVVSMMLQIQAHQISYTRIQAIVSTLWNLAYLPYLGKAASATFPSNGPAWSLSFEMLVNILFGVFLARDRRLPLLPIIGMAAIALVFAFRFKYQVAPGWGSDSVFWGLPRVCFSFFLGVYIFDAVAKSRYGEPQIFPVRLLFLALIFFLWFGYSSAWLLGVLFVAPSLVYLGSASEPQSKKWAKLCNYLGWLSYPLYCVHLPIYNIFRAELGVNYLSSMLAVLCSVVVAHVASKSIEEPVRRRLALAWKAAASPKNA